MVKGKSTKSRAAKAKPTKRTRTQEGPGFREVPTGSSLGVYQTINQQGQPIGWYVVVGDQNVTIGGYTWLADQAYWFWWQQPFPDAFALVPNGNTPPSGLNPAYASPVTTAAPFDTSKKVTPATLTRWWQLNITGSANPVGAMGTNNGVVQYWYEGQPNAYLPVSPGELLMFTPGTQPTAPLYQAVDVIV